MKTQEIFDRITLDLDSKLSGWTGHFVNPEVHYVVTFNMLGEVESIQTMSVAEHVRSRIVGGLREYYD